MSDFKGTIRELDGPFTVSSTSVTLETPTLVDESIWYLIIFTSNEHQWYVELDRQSGLLNTLTFKHPIEGILPNSDDYFASLLILNI